MKLKKKADLQAPAYAYLPLDYDRRCFSWNAFRKEGNFESGNSYAAELLPDSILKAEGIPFRLGEKRNCQWFDLQRQCTSVANRTFLLTTGIYFLAASAGEVCSIKYRNKI